MILFCEPLPSGCQLLKALCDLATIWRSRAQSPDLPARHRLESSTRSTPNRNNMQQTRNFRKQGRTRAKNASSLQGSPMSPKLLPHPTYRRPIVPKQTTRHLPKQSPTLGKKCTDTQPNRTSRVSWSCHGKGRVQGVHRPFRDRQIAKAYDSSEKTSTPSHVSPSWG